MRILRPSAVRFFLTSITVLGLAMAALAASKITVTATIYNFDASNNPFTLQSDGSTSAVYTPESGVSSNLTPNVAGAGVLYYQWSFDLSSSSRAYFLTLTPLSGSPPVFSGALPFNGQLFSRCFTSSGGYQNWTQIQPEFPDASCAMRANFTYNGNGYSLVMSPTETGTGTATVNCTNWSTKANACVAWTDVPTANVTDANVANLYGPGGVVGQYFFSFNITFTHP
jgi:hypothetical protein